MRRAGLVAFIVLVCLLLVDTAAWFWATSRMEAEWGAWRARMLAQGVTVQTAAPSRSGWPMAAALTLQDVSVEGAIAGWHAGTVILDLSPFHPTTLDIDISGPQAVRLDGLPPALVKANGLSASIPLGNPSELRFEGHALQAKFGGDELQVSVLAGRVDPNGAEIAASHLTLPELGLPFGGAVDRVAAHLRVTGPLPPASAMLRPSAAAADWQRAGGQIVVDDATVLWGPLDAQGHFTAGLDPALQPAGSGMLRMTGYHAAIDALVRAGTITRNASRVATTVLDMMATSADPPVVDVPLTVKGGAILMGAIPLLRLPPLTWPP